MTSISHELGKLRSYGVEFAYVNGAVRYRGHEPGLTLARTLMAERRAEVEALIKQRPCMTCGVSNAGSGSEYVQCSPCAEAAVMNRPDAAEHRRKAA